jgi:branched-chain amino acid aminotransferase
LVWMCVLKPCAMQPIFGRVMTNEPLAYLNGDLLPPTQARLALNDGGFVFGATVTDLCRTFRHRLYRWQDHLARFRRSCESASLEVPWSDEEITRRAEELIVHNAALIEAKHDLALVLLATPGPVGFYLGQSTIAGKQPTFGMHTFPLPLARYRPWIEQGVHLITPSVRQVPAVCVAPHIKQRSRMHWWLAEQEVRRTAPDAQALLLDLDGCVTETATANLLLVKNGLVVSPSRESVLEGISLRVVEEFCNKLRIPMAYRKITLDECTAADELLLTCTSYCMVGVRRINQTEMDWPGPILLRLVQAWSDEVGMDFRGQILNG